MVVMNDVLMPVGSGVSCRIVIIVATTTHFGRCDWAFIAMQRLQHLLQSSRVHIHVFGAFRLVPFAAGNLMFMHDVFIVILGARAGPRGDRRLDSLLLVLQRATGLCSLGFACFFAAMRLLVVRVVLIDLQTDVVLLHGRLHGHRAGVGLLSLQSV